MAAVCTGTSHGTLIPLTTPWLTLESAFCTGFSAGQLIRHLLYLLCISLKKLCPFTGSSFPKAKPTLGMRRVVWFALVRLLFLPALYQWWAQQTSPACAKFLLALWLLQVVNISINFMAPTSIDIDVSYN